MSDTLEDFEPAPARDLFFDPTANPQTQRAKDACTAFATIYLAAEERLTPRTRARKDVDATILKNQLEAIFANLVQATKRKKTSPVALSLSKQQLGRKDSHPILNDKLSTTLRLLQVEGLLQLKIGSYEEGRMTTITATEKCISLMDLHSLSARDFKIYDRQPIILRAARTRQDKEKKRTAKELPLPETPEVQRITNEVNSFNAYLKKQSIIYIGNREDIDDERITTYRVFNNGLLSEGGRLYGGFWQHLSGTKIDGKDERETDILLNDEHLVGLDYGQMAVRILYSFAGVEPDLDDLYVLPGWERSREGMKKIINTMINNDRGETKAVRELFHDQVGLTIKQLTNEVKQSIYEYHAPIVKYLDGSINHKVFNEESNHLIRLLLELVALDVPALPVHDCLYIRLRDKDSVQDLMTERFKDYFKVNIYVK